MTAFDDLLPGPLSDIKIWLPLLWAFLLGVAVTLYVCLDGFDLGLGILFPFTPAEHDRDVMMNTVAPFWDGNETWLIFGGAGLFVVFPLAYSIIMPAVYLPIMIMLLALIFRGVAFEYRWVAKPDHWMWDLAFAYGSIVATFMQGVILGALLQGVTVNGDAFSGGMLDWATPFTVFCGIALVFGYALLGATWLIMKTEGELAQENRSRSEFLLIAVVVSMAIVSLWTPFLFERIYDRWFSTPNFYYLMPVPLLTAAAAFTCWRGLRSGSDVVPFFSAIALFLLALIGLVISNAPFMVPPVLTVWEAAAPVSSQLFTLYGTAIMLPVILCYTVFVYYTFRGKVRDGEGYH